MQNDKPTRKDNDNKIIAGIDKHFTDPKPMTIGGKPTTPMALKAIFQADIDANNEVDGARTVWRAAVAKAREARALAAQTRSAVKAYLVGVYGPDAAAIIADFGLPTSKTPGTKSVKGEGGGDRAIGRHAQGPSHDGLAAAQGGQGHGHRHRSHHGKR